MNEKNSKSAEKQRKKSEVEKIPAKNIKSEKKLKKTLRFEKNILA